MWNCHTIYLPLGLVIHQETWEKSVMFDFYFTLVIQYKKGTLLYFSLSKHQLLMEKVSIHSYLWWKMRKKNVYECSRYLKHLKSIKLVSLYSPVFIVAEAINQLLEEKTIISQILACNWWSLIAELSWEQLLKFIQYLITPSHLMILYNIILKLKGNPFCRFTVQIKWDKIQRSKFSMCATSIISV